MKDELRWGSILGKISSAARYRGMSDMDYIEWLLESDVRYVPLKTFARRYKGSIIELASSLDVTKDTISKWRAGKVMKCSAAVGARIYEVYGVNVEVVER